MIGGKLSSIKLSNILFLDIETVPCLPDYHELSPTMQDLWNQKSQRLQTPEADACAVYRNAGVFSEFGKIICISVGYLRYRNSVLTLRIKSFAGDNEKQLLMDFSRLVETHFNKSQNYFCAHNGKEFDFPFIARRMLINGLPIPNNLDTRGLKPWEVKHLDTLDLWRFGDNKNYTSLRLLTEIFGLPTPKEDIDGSMVYDVYWNDNDLPRIVDYCQKDVVAVVQLFQKYCGVEPVSFDNVLLIQ